MKKKINGRILTANKSRKIVDQNLTNRGRTYDRRYDKDIDREKADAESSEAKTLSSEILDSNKGI
jgi:hypothetical protein